MVADPIARAADAVRAWLETPETDETREQWAIEAAAEVTIAVTADGVKPHDVTADIAREAGVTPLTVARLIVTDRVRGCVLRAERARAEAYARRVLAAQQGYAVEQVTAGRMCKDVAEEIGVSRPTVSSWLADHQQRQAADAPPDERMTA